MKFVQKKQFNDYFYNKNVLYRENVNECLHIRARDIFMHLHEKNMLKHSILFIIGPGNNGKLALEIARICAISHIRVHLLFAQHLPSKDEILKSFKTQKDYVQTYSSIHSPLFQALLESDIQIIDGLFATGISSQLDEHYNTIIDYINTHAQAEVISLTLPSGMKNTPHKSTHIHADFVITLDVALVTLLTNHYPISQIICIPSSEQNKPPLIESTLFSTYPSVYKPTLQKDSHKHNRGSIFSFGGTDFFGSSILALKAMLKINACTIHHFGDPLGKYPLLAQIPEVLFHHIDDHIKHVIPTSHIPTVAVLGFGMYSETSLIEHYNTLLTFPSFTPIILDAGGLELLSLPQERSANHPRIITPHIGEFARMSNTSIKHILRERLTLAQSYAKEHHVILVLKGDQTLVTDGTHCWVNPAGNPLLATPGSGDVLAGVIAAHIDQTTTVDNLFARVCQAVYRHSLTADKLIDQHNITASTLIEHL